jgi:hypothetical protein
MMFQDRDDGRVEYGEETERGADAIWTVPERGSGENVRGQKAEIVWVGERCEK